MFGKSSNCLLMNKHIFSKPFRNVNNMYYRIFLSWVSNILAWYKSNFIHSLGEMRMLAGPLRRNKVRPTKPYYSNIPSTGVMDPDPGDQVLSGVYFFSFCSGGGANISYWLVWEKNNFFLCKNAIKKKWEELEKRENFHCTLGEKIIILEKKRERGKKTLDSFSFVLLDPDLERTSTKSWKKSYLIFLDFLLLMLTL